jgi:integrase
MSLERARRGNGWVVRWREHGRQRSRLFERKRDAQAFEIELRRRRQLGPLALEQLTNRGGPTLDQWIEQRWAPEHAATLAQSTCERYANVYACHIAAPLGDLPLREITVRCVREWQVGLAKAGVNPGTIIKCRTLLSSILRHAAESEAIPGNPMTLVRAPKPAHHDAVKPLSPAVVESIRRQLLEPSPRDVSASRPGQRQRRRYQLPAPGDAQSRRRDALIVALLAYAGLRPGELCALRWDDIRESTILVQRAANPDGTLKATKTEHHRTVALLPPLARELREYRLAAGRPPENRLLLTDGEGNAWSKSSWQMWRVDRWAPACRAAGLDPVPRPYDLRHSFASLLLAQGRQPVLVAKQAGHSLAVLLSTYAHLIDEYADRERVDPELEIVNARRQCAQEVRQGGV